MENWEQPAAREGCSLSEATAIAEREASAKAAEEASPIIQTLTLNPTLNPNEP